MFVLGDNLSMAGSQDLERQQKTKGRENGIHAQVFDYAVNDPERWGV